MIHYLISDVHLFPEPREHPGREELCGFLSRLLESEQPGGLWILGDLFDFWFEYRSVIPSGHHRVLRLLGDLTDSGWKLVLLPGNHDSWIGPALEAMTGGRILDDRIITARLGGFDTVLSHGDGLGSGDAGYRLFLRPILRSPLSRFLFSLLHPDLGAALARFFSGTSKRILRRQAEAIPEGLASWADEMLGSCDLVVTAHTHLPNLRSTPRGCHLSLGDWLTSFAYAVIDGSLLELHAGGGKIGEYRLPEADRPVDKPPAGSESSIHE